MAKTLTAVAILMLEEDGKIDLDDPVTKHLPEFPYPEVRVRHLLSHSDALHPRGVYFGPVAADGGTRTNQLLLEILAQHTPPLAFPPGSVFYYGGTGFCIAALLVERVTGDSFAAFLDEHILEPLDMDSSFIRPARQRDWEGVRTIGYRRADDGTLELHDVSDNEGVYGQGGIDYSARDLYRWAASFYSRPVLSESALQAGLEGPILGDGHRSAINLLSWYYPERGRRFYFTGDSWGFYSFVYWDVDRRHSFAYVSNTRMPNWLRSLLARALIDILEGREHAPLEAPGYAELSVTPLSQEPGSPLPSLQDFASILGAYEMQPAGEVTISEPPADWLNVGWVLPAGWFAPVVQANDGLRYNIFPVGDEMLYVPGLDAWVGFTEDEGGRMIHWTRVLEGTSTGRVGE